MLIRETALIYVVIMAVIAWIEGERREAAAWVGATLVFFVALAAHAHAVTLVTGPLDRSAQGLSGLEGSASCAARDAVVGPRAAAGLAGGGPDRDRAVRVAGVARSCRCPGARHAAGLCGGDRAGRAQRRLPLGADHHPCPAGRDRLRGRWPARPDRRGAR
ncbi:hypothetical protein QP185_15485 [Sphingomonas aerolata]|uniref:hypothetical protein n=1 Tax=Sphingomonas aerolata TaxID=185951 RepID=UPI002FE29FFC